MAKLSAVVVGLILCCTGCAAAPCADSEPALAERPGMLRSACAGIFGPCIPRRYFSIYGYDACWDRIVVRDAATCNARRAYRQFCRATDSRYSTHFRDGFCSAYVNDAQGFPPTTPPVPPAKYWSAHFRTQKGHAQAADWYAGYEAGMASAQSDAIGDFNVVPAEVVLEREGFRPAGPPVYAY